MDIFDKSLMPLYESHARSLWKIAHSQRGSRYMESWIYGLAYRCTGGAVGDFYTAAEDNKATVQSIASLFFESMHARKQLIQQDPAYQAVLKSTTADELMDAMASLLKRCTTYFKNDCIETWRNIPGTFAYVYRKTQNSLRDCMTENWSLYENSQYYGPARLHDTDPTVDIEDEQKLRGIVLPFPAPDEKDIFKAAAAFSLATHFHHEVCCQRHFRDAGTLTTRAKIAIRNLSRWFCCYYTLLDAQLMPATARAPREAAPDGHDDAFGAGTLHSEPDSATLDRIDTYARNVAARMTEEQCRMYVLRHVELRSLAETSDALGFSGPSQVSQKMEKVHRYLRAEMLKVPELCCAIEEDAYEALPVDTRRAELFLLALGEHCKRGGCHA